MKIKAVLYIVGLMFLVPACANSSGKLSKEKYTDIILDLQVAETIVMGTSGINKDSLRRTIHNRICEIYGFKDIEALKSSLLPLESDPELMLEITKIMSKKLDQLADSAISNPIQ